MSRHGHPERLHGADWAQGMVFRIIQPGQSGTYLSLLGIIDKMVMVSRPDKNSAT